MCVCFDFNFLLASIFEASRACFGACLRYVRAFNWHWGGAGVLAAGGPRGRWAAGGAARPRTMAVCGWNLNLKLTCLDFTVTLCLFTSATSRSCGGAPPMVAWADEVRAHGRVPHIYCPHPNALPSSISPRAQTADDFFARACVLPIALLPCLPAEGLSAGHALEVFGERGTGKTALLMECALNCILPRAPYGGGGHGASAVLFDIDGGFDALRLSAALELRLHEARPELTAAELEREVVLCLDRLHVVQCLTPRELVLALGALRRRLEALPTTTSAATAAAAADGGAAGSWDAIVSAPRLLLLDSLSAFQWLECGRKRERPEASGEAAGTAFISPPSCLPEVSALLSALRHRLTVVWSRLPRKFYEGCFEFPNSEGNLGVNLGVNLGAAGLALLPSFRLRLRFPSLNTTHGCAMSEPEAEGAHLRFQALLDGGHGATSTHSGCSAVTAPLHASRHDLLLSMRGVTLLAGIVS